MASISDVRRPLTWGASTMVIAGLLFAGSGGANAYEFNAGPDWEIHWDNTFSYNLGMRAQSINPAIGNNPVYSENDYKFASAGSIVTNRFSDLSELDAEYTDGDTDFGGRLSGSGWKDFAYDDKVLNNPGDVAPGTPYTALNSYRSNVYSNRTERYYIQGAELLDAFVFDNFTAYNHPSSIKLGRVTRYWGQALFFGTQAISYSQNAADDIKAASAPGTEAKELAIPRGQILLTTNLTPDISLEGQYFLEYDHNLLPEGGTYLGVTGFLFDGPGFLEGAIPHGYDFEPRDQHGNFGFKLDWSPDWLRGDAAIYFRHFDETQPWAPLFAGAVSGGSIVPTNYHLSYANNVKLYGASLEKTVGDYSVGAEVSYRQNTALNSTTLNVPQILATGSSSGATGATGDTINFIANVEGGLTPTPVWNTGSFVAEAAVTHLVQLDNNANLYNGVANKGALGGCPTGSMWDGCSTDTSVSVAGLFDPTWLQVIPGVDLDAPIFAEYGVLGNTPSLGSSVNQAGLIYTAGIHALYRETYNITLQYNGYHFPHDSSGTSFAPGSPSYWGGGNGTPFYNDKGWVSLTLKASF